MSHRCVLSENDRHPWETSWEVPCKSRSLQIFSTREGRRHFDVSGRTRTSDRPQFPVTGTRTVGVSPEVVGTPGPVVVVTPPRVGTQVGTRPAGGTRTCQSHTTGNPSPVTSTSGDREVPDRRKETGRLRMSTPTQLKSSRPERLFPFRWGTSVGLVPYTRTHAHVSPWTDSAPRVLLTPSRAGHGRTRCREHRERPEGLVMMSEWTKDSG